ncbi:MAG TPA: hypothetical protein VES88_01400 [Gemmatimonadaceae bacterium]|nr:hypothetical protein [Gemmatimonadaceae bacterium]
MSAAALPSTGMPAMSVVLATDTWNTILPVINRLNDLTTRRQLEIVLVMPASQSKTIGAERLTDFASVRIVDVDSSIPLGAARASGVRAATAPLVFIGETHSYPCSGMIEALTEAHEAGWGVVVPSFANANPDGAVSWAGFLAGYASWTDGKPAEELHSAPILNVSYRLTFLLNLGDRLEQALSEGEDMMAELRRAGERVRFEPAARIEHANISFLAPLLHQRFLAGRVIAGTRSARWSAFRRLGYALASPLIPAVLLVRHRDGISRAIRRERPPSGAAAVLVLCSVLQAAGEMVGYALGVPESVRKRYDDYEIRRLEDTRIRGNPRSHELD